MNVLTYVTMQVGLKDRVSVLLSRAHCSQNGPLGDASNFDCQCISMFKWVNKQCRDSSRVITAWSTVKRCIAYCVAMKNKRHTSEIELIKHVSILALAMDGLMFWSTGIALYIILNKLYLSNIYGQQPKFTDKQHRFAKYPWHCFRPKNNA